MNDAHTVGYAETKITRFHPADCEPEALEGLAAHIEGALVPLTILESSQLIAALLRRVAKMELRLRDFGEKQ